MVWGWSGIHDETDADYRLMRNSGANVVRLCISRFYWNYPIWQNKLDQIIDWCGQLGLHVILDYHSKTQDPSAWSDMDKIDEITAPADWIDWLKEVAFRYKNNPTVCGINVMNEPPPYTAWSSAGYTKDEADMAWRNAALEVARALHSVNPNLLVFVGNNNWCASLEQFILNPLPEPNVVYVFHRYYWADIGYQDYANDYRNGNFEVAKTEMETLYKQVAFDLIDKGYPVILLEFGYQGTEPNWQVQAKDCYDLMKKYEAGYIQWVFHGETGATPVGTTYGMLTKDWSALNERGQLWADIISS